MSAPPVPFAFGPLSESAARILAELERILDIDRSDIIQTALANELIRVRVMAAFEKAGRL